MATCNPSPQAKAFLAKPVVQITLSCAKAGLNVGTFIGVLVFTMGAAGAACRLFR